MDISLPYMAGFFDGEGCIGVYRNGNKAPFLRTQLTQNVTTFSGVVFEAYQAKFGGNCRIQETLSKKTNYNWQLNSIKAVHFLHSIRPYLVLKREQCDIAIAWHAARPPQRKGLDGRFQSSKFWLDEPVIRLMKALKTQELDSVLAAQTDLVEVLHTLKQGMMRPGRR